MPKKKLRTKKTYEEEHVPGEPWGDAEDLEHWVVLMHRWAKQVTSDIHLIKKCDALKDCLKDDPEWKRLMKGKNPDDPPDPPWGFG
jgi:hypothetical protein